MLIWWRHGHPPSDHADSKQHNTIIIRAKKPGGVPYNLVPNMGPVDISITLNISIALDISIARSLSISIARSPCISTALHIIIGLHQMNTSRREQVAAALTEQVTIINQQFWQWGVVDPVNLRQLCRLIVLNLAGPILVHYSAAEGLWLSGHLSPTENILDAAEELILVESLQGRLTFCLWQLAFDAALFRSCPAA